jgi:hypothetical protein
MAHGAEPILYQHKQVACVFRASLRVSGLQFFTSPQNPLQIGIHDHTLPMSTHPHIHDHVTPAVISQYQEFLFVTRGKIRVDIISHTKKRIASKLLSQGDAILLQSEGHSVKFFKNARIFEIKQGPFLASNTTRI